MKKAVIVSAARTPVGKFGGSLKDIPAYQLGSIAIERGNSASRLKARAD